MCHSVTVYFTGIASTDIASIFEEHCICKNSSMLHCEQYRDSMGIYVQDENKFVFNHVLVGQSAKAQFRLTNPGKVSCELSLGIKTVKVCLWEVVLPLFMLFCRTVALLTISVFFVI